MGFRITLRRADIHPHCTRCQVCIHVPVVPLCPLGGGLLAFLFSTESVHNPEAITKRQGCRIWQEWTGFTGKRGQQAFSPVLSLPFLRAVIRTAMQVCPETEATVMPCSIHSGHNETAQTPTAALRNKKERKAERMSRNSRNTNRNTSRSRQTKGVLSPEREAARLSAKEVIGRKMHTGADLRHRSHYAAVGAASLPRRAGRRY